MQSEIQLQKRSGKAVLHILAALFCLPITIMSIIRLIGKFDWFVVAIAAVTAIMSGIVIYRLVQYFTYGDIKLIVESDGKTIRFFNRAQNGKIFNQTEDIALSGIRTFFVVHKIRRYGMSNYYFGYDKGGLLGRESIAAFPPLFEATPQERETVLQFVKSCYPEIELGYENFFQKLAKK